MGALLSTHLVITAHASCPNTLWDWRSAVQILSRTCLVKSVLYYFYSLFYYCYSLYYYLLPKCAVVQWFKTRLIWKRLYENNYFKPLANVTTIAFTTTTTATAAAATTTTTTTLSLQTIRTAQ